MVRQRRRRSNVYAVVEVIPLCHERIERVILVDEGSSEQKISSFSTVDRRQISLRLAEGPGRVCEYINGAPQRSIHVQSVGF